MHQTSMTSDIMAYISPKSCPLNPSWQGVWSGQIVTKWSPGIYQSWRVALVLWSFLPFPRPFTVPPLPHPPSLPWPKPDGDVQVWPLNAWIHGRGFQVNHRWKLWSRYFPCMNSPPIVLVSVLLCRNPPTYSHEPMHSLTRALIQSLLLTFPLHINHLLSLSCSLSHSLTYSRISVSHSFYLQ